jgi:hypothetical protein
MSRDPSVEPRRAAFLAVAFVALLGCGSNQGPQQVGLPGEFLRVSMEEGGFCGPTAVNPCWYRTAVASVGTIHLERFDSAVQRDLSADDAAQVSVLVNRSDFRSAVASKDRQCPVVFDAEVVLVFRTSEAEKQDIGVGGCISGDDAAMKHPYNELWTLLRSLRRKYFPGALPE